MSMYNMLFGENSSQREFLLSILDLNDFDFGRYRDIFVTDEHIVVHTRNGGGNRDCYEYVFEAAEQHPLYSHDEDDDFDCTYANIYFRHPAGYEELLKELATGTITPSEKWNILLTALRANKQ
jgi:hypothetical protein